MLLAVAGICLLAPAAAELTVFEGDSITVTDADSTLTWGKNYTFDAAGSAIYSDSFYLNMSSDRDRNISITSNTSEQINTTLWEYDFSDITPGDEIIRAEVSAVENSDVILEFTGVPAISNGEYVVYRDNSVLETFSTGGTLTWSDSDWSTHNYSVIYEEDEENEEPFFKAEITALPNSIILNDTLEVEVEITNTGDANGTQEIILNIDDSEEDSQTLSLEAEESTTHIFEWDTRGASTGIHTAEIRSENDSDEVSFTVEEEEDNDDINSGSSNSSSSSSSSSNSSDTESEEDEYTHCWDGTDTSFSQEGLADDLSYLSISTAEETNNPCLNVDTVEQLPEEIPIPNSTYKYYNFTPSLDNDDITEVSLNFEIESDFAQQYDRIIVQRYSNGWEKLDTQLVDNSGSIWEYEASVSGFSYYAVTGENKNNSSNQESTDPREQAGNDTHTGEESSITEELLGWLPFIAGFLLLVALGIIAYFYKKYEPSLNTAIFHEDVEELESEVRSLIKKQKVRDQKFVTDKLNKAENALSHDNYKIARIRLQELKNYLEQD